MNGSEIFVFTLSAVPKLVKNTLAKNNLEAQDIDVYVFHQANRYMLDSLRKKIKIDESRFYVCMEHCGNTVSSTIPIALYHAQQENTFKSGQKVLLAGFGVGYSWAGNVLTIK
jgi:3-oxoacyl-[acyl-carrier-protein] synthase-3